MAETQVNKFLLDNTYNISKNLFRGNIHHIIISSNKYELIIKHQQEGVLIAIRAKYIKLVTATGLNSTGLSR